MKLLPFAIILFALSTIGLSQQLLFYKNNHREEIYKTNDVISFRLKGDDSKITGRISGFEDSLIVFQDFKINPKEISHLYVDNKTRTWFIFRYKYQIVLPIVGAGYILLDLLNTGKLNEGTLVVGGSLIGAGLLARLLISDRIKITGRRKLVILR
jgi:hypothetical protein